MVFQNVLWAMEHKRLTLTDLREVLRLSEGTISRKLSGKVELLPHEKEIIAQKLGYDPVWLFAPARPVPLKRPIEAQAASYEIEPESAEIVPDDYGAADVERELGITKKV